MEFLAPCRVTAFTTPEVEIALLVAGPPMALPLFLGQAVDIDVGVGDLFVDEWHGVGSPGGLVAGVAASTSSLIIPRW